MRDFIRISGDFVLEVVFQGYFFCLKTAAATAADAVAVKNWIYKNSPTISVIPYWYK